ncbi:MAG: patatin-like phospholipase family protein, partial [Pontibacterium sp.]
MSPVVINLALQGGGAHGAYTWGVLERLLDEPHIFYEGISGTSAGAMNAVMFAEGWRKGGPDGAKAQLQAFWDKVAAQKVSMFTLPESLNNSMTQWLLTTSHFVSPYDISHRDLNPLRHIVSDLVDFEALRAHKPFKLHIAATEVKSGKLKLFKSHELEVDHVLASACLPNIHHAVEIDGEYFWDGGFSGNPAIFPLVYECDADDVLIVLLQPLERNELPKSASEISDRMSDLGFQSAFMREMAALARFKVLAKTRIKPRWLQSKFDQRINSLRTHLMANDDYLGALDRSSKYNNQKQFLYSLRDAGYQSA